MSFSYKASCTAAHPGYSTWQAMTWFWGTHGSAITGNEPSALSQDSCERLVVTLKESDLHAHMKEIKRNLE